MDKTTSVDRFDYSEGAELSSLVSLDDTILHNNAQKIADEPLTIAMLPQAWAYGFGLPVHAGVLHDNESALIVRCTLTVKQGHVSIGGMADDLTAYISDEIAVAPDGGHEQIVSLFIPSSKRLAWLIVRTGSQDTVAPLVQVHSIRVFQATAYRRPHLEEVAYPESPDILTSRHKVEPIIVSAANVTVHAHCAPALDGVRLLLAHCSRTFEPSRCTQDFLRARYSTPGRLERLPPFNSLPPRVAHPSYNGPLSILEMRSTASGLALVPVRCFDTPDSISHACLVGGRLVLCFEHFLYVMESPEADIDGVFFDEGNPDLISDNWFCDLHTVFPVDENVCIVSGSSGDAVFWVDIAQRKVVRRWRLPAEIYGMNYELLPGMSLHEHFIDNDKQLGHLNCAYPDAAGGCIISTLGQGDIGHVDAAGQYRLLARGYVGCHGVRYAMDGSIYFASSCTGQLFRIDRHGEIAEVIAVQSKWFQDIEQITEDIFVFCLSDRNEISIIDVTRKQELGRFHLGARGNTTGFVSVIPAPVK